MTLLLGGCSLSSLLEDDQSTSATSSGVQSTPSPSYTPRRAEDGPTAMDTFRALAPPEGIKYTELFHEPVSDPAVRMQRLESEVQTLRNDFDTVTPTLVRLAAIEKDMQELVKQLQTLGDQPATASVVGVPLAAPMPAPAQPPMAAPIPDMPMNTAPATAQPPVALRAPAAQKIPGGDTAGGTETAGKTMPEGSTASSSLVTPEAAPKGELPPEGAASPNSASAHAKVKQVRTGDHPDKTRVVLDVSAKTPYKARLENGNMTLVIEAPGADWSAIKPYDALSAALVAGWRVEGDKLILDLLYPSQIKSDSLLPPNGSPDHRLVVDLFSSDVHK